MKPKSIIIALVLALVFLILFNNKEESSFWLFGEIRTSKLLILGIFFLLGVITGGILFRRKNKHPEEYVVTNISSYQKEEFPHQDQVNMNSQLSDDDKEFLRND